MCLLWRVTIAYSLGCLSISSCLNLSLCFSTQSSVKCFQNLILSQLCRRMEERDSCPCFDRSIKGELAPLEDKMVATMLFRLKQGEAGMQRSVQCVGIDSLILLLLSSPSVGLQPLQVRCKMHMPSTKGNTAVTIHFKELKGGSSIEEEKPKGWQKPSFSGTLGLIKITYLPHALPGACPENGHPDRGHPPEQGIWSPQSWLPFPWATNIFMLNSVLEVCLFLRKCVLLRLIRQKLLSFSVEYEESYYNISKNSRSGIMRKCLRGNTSKWLSEQRN